MLHPFETFANLFAAGCIAISVAALLCIVLCNFVKEAAKRRKRQQTITVIDVMLQEMYAFFKLKMGKENGRSAIEFVCITIDRVLSADQIIGLLNASRDMERSSMNSAEEEKQKNGKRITQKWIELFYQPKQGGSNWFKLTEDGKKQLKAIETICRPFV